MSGGTAALVLAALWAEPGATVLDVARAVYRSSPDILLLGERNVADVLELLRSEGMVQVADGRWSLAEDGPDDGCWGVVARAGWARAAPGSGGACPARCVVRVAAAR